MFCYQSKKAVLNVSVLIPAILVLITTGCWNADFTATSKKGAVVTGDMVTGQKKTITLGIKDMMTNKRAVLSNIRAAEGDDPDAVESLVSEVFEDAMNNLPEEDRAEILESGKVEMNLTSALELTEEQQKMVIRDVDGTTVIADSGLEMFQLNGRLNTLFDVTFGEVTVSKDQLSDFLSSDYLAQYTEDPRLDRIAIYLASVKEYSKIKDLAVKFACDLDLVEFDEITNRIQEITNTDQTADASSKNVTGRWSSSGDDGGNYPVPTWLVPENLNDATVFLVRSSGPVEMVSYFTHSGLFSKEWFYQNKDSEPDVFKTKCIQSAAPPKTCLQPLSKFVTSQVFAGILPKNYSIDRAAAACRDAESIFKCSTGGVSYYLPWWEVLNIFTGGSSHDLSSENTYCCKVPYTGWKRNGANIDADFEKGALITPDEIRYSTNDRYLFNPITIKIYYWKPWKWRSRSITIGWHMIKTYSARTNCLFDVRR